MTNTKKKFADHLQYNWLKYALAAVIIIFLWIVVFDSLAKPANDEKVAVEFFGDGINYDGINALLAEKTREISAQELKEIMFYESYTSAEAMPTTIQAKNITSDILILPEILLRPNDNGVVMIEAQNFFEKLPTDRLAEIWSERGLGDFSSVELYCVDGVPYGIYINKAIAESADKCRFDEFYIGGDRCVAFFAVYSQNVCAIYGEGNASDGACFDVLAFLMEESDG